MDESILKALMRLFAIIATVTNERVSKSARSIVESYLNNQLNKEFVDKYLLLFDEYINLHRQDIHDSTSSKGRKRNASKSVKVLLICQQINETLQQKEKIIVLLRLLEFVNDDGIIGLNELDFVDTVADTFKIGDLEYRSMKSFVLDELDFIFDDEKLLVIDSNKTEKVEFTNKDGKVVQLSDAKHIYKENLSGRINVLHITESNTFVFRYTGKDNLYLNGLHINPLWTYVLSHGTLIKSSRFNPIYYNDITSRFFFSKEQTKIVLTAENIEFTFKNSENGIQCFNFSEESGQLIGIMGGSGVGKSTLLNLLNGKIKPSSGKISINGYDIHEEADKLKGIIGFVPQDDLLIEELTVFQNLYYNAKLCFSSFTEKQIIIAVAKILIDLELNEIKHLTVGNPLNKFISGGQRKRLNIALELIREPSILFVDEPTSGLSSMDSEIVMLLLKQQTLKSRLVIANIHQPSSDIYKLFDKLLIIDKGGRPIYYGNPIDAIVYFKTVTNHANAEESECHACGNVNPEQILQIVEEKVVNEYGKFTRNRKVSPQQWYDLYKKNIDSKFKPKEASEKLPESKFKIPNLWRQFKIFGIRNLLSKLTNRQYMLINFAEAPLLAIIIGYFTKYISGTADNPSEYLFSENENMPAYLFMSVIVALFIGLTVSAEEIIRDRKILQRESFLNLSRFSYINSKIIILFIISAIQMILFVLVGNYIVELRGFTFSHWLLLLSTAVCANMIGLNISSALNSVVSIYILIPLILVPQLLFSGVIVSFDKLHKNITSDSYTPIIGDLMTSRWAYEGLIVQQFKENAFQKNFFEFEQKMSEYSYRYSLLLPQLETKVNECEKRINTENNNSKQTKDLLIIKNEVKKLQAEVSDIKRFKYQLSDSLTTNKFTPEIALKTRIFLNNLKEYYSQKYDKVRAKKDIVFEKLVYKLGSKEKVYKLKELYFNNSLADLATNKKEILMISESNEQMIQKKDPIYKYPTHQFGRAQFYAPVKLFLNFYIDTFWFNNIVIWIMSILLYIALYYDSLRKLLNSYDSFKSRRKNNLKRITNWNTKKRVKQLQHDAS